MQKILCLRLRDEEGLMVSPFGTTMTNAVPTDFENGHETLGIDYLDKSENRKAKT